MNLNKKDVTQNNPKLRISLQGISNTNHLNHTKSFSSHSYDKPFRMRSLNNNNNNKSPCKKQKRVTAIVIK